MTQRVGVVGYPVEHSISPPIQQAALDALGVDARYERWAVAPADLVAWVAGLRAADVLGANVTVPHKEAVLPLLDELTDTARAIGAVNTIVNDGGRLRGDNTDAAGFLRALDDVGGPPPGGEAVLLGAGGAARAVGHALVGVDIGALIVANRDAARAERLVASLRAAAPAFERLTAVGLDDPALDGALASCALLVNATTVGLQPGQRLLDVAHLPESALVIDLIYNPPVTALLADAEQRGARVLNGLPMLVYQAALAFERWTGRQPPLETMFAAARAALA